MGEKIDKFKSDVDSLMNLCQDRLKIISVEFELFIIYKSNIVVSTRNIFFKKRERT